MKTLQVDSETYERRWESVINFGEAYLRGEGGILSQILNLYLFFSTFLSHISIDCEVDHKSALALFGGVRIISSVFQNRFCEYNTHFDGPFRKFDVPPSMCAKVFSLLPI